MANAIMYLRLRLRLLLLLVLVLVLVLENGLLQIDHEQEHPPSPGYGVAGECDYEEAGSRNHL
jgi:hypothetical protein